MDLNQYRTREYERHTPPEGTDFHPVPSWGRDGWDLGQWPLVVISHGTMPDGRHAIRYYVEGDVDYYVTPDETTRDAVTDYLAWFHWSEKLGGTFEDMPAERRGPFSWARLDAERVR